jgi:carboxymethylenebutenolidase
MIEEEIEIRTSDGVSGGFLYRAEGERPLPGIIHLTDIGGIRPSQHEMARRLAAKGYCVLMPNVFYRTGRPPVFDFPETPTEEQRRERFVEVTRPLPPEAMERDGVSYVDYLAAHNSVSPGAMGVVGYCFTGSMAIRIAAARPDRIGAAAAFHGGGLFSDAPTSPHLVLPRIQAWLYFGHAINDRSMTEDAIEKLNQALEAWGGNYESEVYQGAYHGWTVPDSPVYNQPQAERAFEKQTELFQKTLK